MRKFEAELSGPVEVLDGRTRDRTGQGAIVVSWSSNARPRPSLPGSYVAATKLIKGEYHGEARTDNEVLREIVRLMPGLVVASPSVRAQVAATTVFLVEA